VTGTSASKDSIDLLCESCGETFSAFLHEMAEHNAKVVCPKCRKNADCKPESARSAFENATVSKTVH
jgi:hypothetical protein